MSSGVFYAVHAEELNVGQVQNLATEEKSRRFV
jgi:hypothetical protein